MSIHGTFSYAGTTINQYKYPHRLYEREVQIHADCFAEYEDDISLTLLRASVVTQPNFKLYDNQPYINASVRAKLVDFLLRMAVRLKLVPYVFCKAVRLFDRYCSKRIVLLQQAQLVATTCLWISAKVYGGNNHFANLSSSKCGQVKTISNLGYGSGARFCGPTERYRMPKICELVKLCGARCNYDISMFKQMELHIMSTLDWNLVDTAVDEFLVDSRDLKSCTDVTNPQKSDIATLKAFVSYASCYQYELIKYTPVEVAKAAVDLLNETFHLTATDAAFLTLNNCIFAEIPDLNARQDDIRNLLIQAVVSAPDYLLHCFDTSGPRYLYSSLTKTTKMPPPIDTGISTPTESSYPTPTSAPHFDVPSTNYTYTKPTNVSLSSESYAYETSPSIDGVPFVSKSVSKGLKISVTEAANINSHHYPLLRTQGSKGPMGMSDLLPQPRQTLQESFYKNNNSSTSIASSNSSKGSDMFYDSHRYGISTPISIEDDKSLMKKKKSS
ncbi:cyclin [Candidozyma auris]|uniref:Cyclin-like domain-containing protein n=2 Tax=Candidozyma auris TaxID=498019 RepID=A0A2H0ZC85_CANAR|nr:hypothetical protein QG37_01047 [[Candida] auris]PIS48261.1 hypothetical protein B9J08_004946 [[Candida] auris]QWW24941.1 hypothetical protein CA7LBN_003798 [[Candida] auris]